MFGWILMDAVQAAGIAVMFSLFLCHSIMGAEVRRPGWVVPVETQDVRADWTVPADMPPLRRVVDEATGQWCLEYHEVSPLKGRVFYTEFDRDLIDGHDTLRFRWKVVGDNCRVRAQVSGYPAPGRRKRNYYLGKRPPEPGRWQEVWLDLNNDDDAGAGCTDATEGKVRVAFAVSLWDMGELSNPPRVRVRFSNVRFERHPVRLKIDLNNVENLATDQHLGQRYPLTLINRSEESQRVKLGIESSRMKAFEVVFPERSVRLAPGASRELTALVRTRRERAAELPPLYSERAAVFAATEKSPDRVTPAHHGYLLHRLVGAVPPRVEYPLFKTPEQKQQARAQRGKAGAGKKVEDLLDISVEPPELRHGYSGAYMDPGPPRKTMRFHGPGRHYSERTRDYIDIEKMPESVQKAGAFAHHSFLSRAAHELAEAWWRTGREEFARKSAEILLAYAARYPDYGPAKKYATGYCSRVGHAVLGECWWFGEIPEAFDLVRASGVLSEEDEQRIVDGLIVPAMITISTHRVAANQQAEVNASYGKAALAAQRWDYAAQALDGEYGMRAQWEIDFDADGFSMEREMPYHFAALEPFVAFANCLEAAGVEVYDANFKRLFDAPIAYDIQGRPGRAGLYVHAYRHYRDPDYLPLVADRLEADEMPKETISREYTNSVLPAGGYTTLRTGDEDSGLRAVTMNWGCPSHRGGNVLLNPRFYWKGHALNEHVFRIGYGYEQSHFSYTAAAGNAVVKDGRKHSMLRADQVALLEGECPAGRWTTPLDRPQYRGVRWSRTAAICGDSMVLIDQVESQKPGRWDWLTYLPAGIVDTTPELEWKPYEALAEEGDGYDYFQDPAVASGGTWSGPQSDDALRLTYRLKKGTAEPSGHLTLISPATKLLRAEGYISWHPRLVPVLIQRRGDAPNFWSVAVYTGVESKAGDQILVEKVPVRREDRRLSDTEAVAVRVQNAAGTFLVLSSQYEGEHSVGDTTMDGPLSVHQRQ